VEKGELENLRQMVATQTAEALALVKEVVENPDGESSFRRPLLDALTRSIEATEFSREAAIRDFKLTRDLLPGAHPAEYLLAERVTQSHALSLALTLRSAQLAKAKAPLADRRAVHILEEKATLLFLQSITDLVKISRLGAFQNLPPT
jgi:hypothetical protein